MCQNIYLMLKDENIKPVWLVHHSCITHKIIYTQEEVGWRSEWNNTTLQLHWVEWQPIPSGHRFCGTMACRLRVKDGLILTWWAPFNPLTGQYNTIEVMKESVISCPTRPVLIWVYINVFISIQGDFNFWC